MLFGSIKDIPRLTGCNSCGDCEACADSDRRPLCRTYLAEAFQWLVRNEAALSAMALGRHEISPTSAQRDRYGEKGQADIYVNVEDTRLRAEGEALFERHYKYADIQLVLEGEEAFQVALDGLASSVPYVMERDIEFFQGASCIQGVLRPGQFVLYRAGEAHRPALSTKDSPAVIRKAVIKVRDDGKVPRF